MDGTFNIAPPLFTQVYSIHADFLGRSHPLVFSLLTNKRQATYRALLNELSNIGNYVFQPYPEVRVRIPYPSTYPYLSTGKENVRGTGEF